MEGRKEEWMDKLMDLRVDAWRTVDGRAGGRGRQKEATHLRTSLCSRRQVVEEPSLALATPSTLFRQPEGMVVRWRSEGSSRERRGRATEDCERAQLGWGGRDGRLSLETVAAW